MFENHILYSSFLSILRSFLILIRRIYISIAFFTATVNVSVTAGISFPIFWVNITDLEDDTINATAICDPIANLPVCFFKILDSKYNFLGEVIPTLSPFLKPASYFKLA